MFTQKFSFYSLALFTIVVLVCLSAPRAVAAQTEFAIASEDCAFTPSTENTHNVTCEVWLSSRNLVSEVLLSSHSPVSLISFSAIDGGTSIAFATSLSSLSDNQVNALKQALKVQFASIADTSTGLYQIGNSLEVLSPLGGSSDMASRGIDVITNTLAQDKSEPLFQLFKVMQSQSSQRKLIVLMSDQIELDANRFNEWVENHPDSVRLVFVQLAVSEFLSNQFSTITHLAAQTGGYDVLASESEWLSTIASAVDMAGRSLTFSFDIGETCGSHAIDVTINAEDTEYLGLLDVDLGDCPVVEPPIQPTDIAEPVTEDELDIPAGESNSEADAEPQNNDTVDLSNEQPEVPEQDANDESAQVLEQDVDVTEADAESPLITEQSDTSDVQEESETNEDVADTSSNEGGEQENNQQDSSEQESTQEENNPQVPSDDAVEASEPEVSNGVVVYIAIGGLVALVVLIVLITRRKKEGAPSSGNEAPTNTTGVVLPKALLLVKDIDVLEQPITGELTFIGRLDTNNIVLQNDTVSSKHCVIKVVNGQLVIVDLSSTNGTRVNGKQVDEAVLSNGDIVDLGEVEINVVIGGENA